MSQEFDITVRVRLDDDTAMILSSVMEDGPAHAIASMVRNSLAERLDVLRGVAYVVSVEDSENGSDSLSPAPRKSVASFDADTATLSARRPAPARSGGMSGAARKGGPSGRTGRPATLHDYTASDGEPVRASGPRSIETLVSEGIKVYRLDDNGRKIRVGADGSPMGEWKSSDSPVVKVPKSPATSVPAFPVRKRGK